MLKRVMSRFYVEFFSLTVPKIFVGEPFCVCFTEFLVMKNFKDKRRGKEGVSRFSVKNFLSRSTEKFVGEPFCAVSENFRQGKSLWIRGEYKDFPSIILSQCQKFRKGTL